MKARLEGLELIKCIDTHPNLTRLGLCLVAGYEESYEEFDDAVSKARKEHGVYVDPMKVTHDWYESLSEQDKRLWEQIEEDCLEWFERDAERCQWFLDELKKLGIETAEVFEDAFIYETDYEEFVGDPFAVFTKWYVENNCPQNIEDGVSYDWKATWNTVLKKHFDVIAVRDAETYFFKKNNEKGHCVSTSDLGGSQIGNLKYGSEL